MRSWQPLNWPQLKDKSQAESLRNEVVKIVSKSKPPRSNISRAEREAIKALAKDDSIVILPADKGCTTVIINKQDYHTKVKALLDDTNTYEKLTSDPTRAIKNKLIQILKEWRKEERIPNYLYNRTVPQSRECPKVLRATQDSQERRTATANSFEHW